MFALIYSGSPLLTPDSAEVDLYLHREDAEEVAYAYEVLWGIIMGVEEVPPGGFTGVGVPPPPETLTPTLYGAHRGEEGAG